MSCGAFPVHTTPPVPTDSPVCCRKAAGAAIVSGRHSERRVTHRDPGFLPFDIYGDGRTKAEDLHRVFISVIGALAAAVGTS